MINTYDLTVIGSDIGDQVVVNFVLIAKHTAVAHIHSIGTVGIGRSLGKEIADPVLFYKHAVGLVAKQVKTISCGKRCVQTVRSFNHAA